MDFPVSTNSIRFIYRYLWFVICILIILLDIDIVNEVDSKPINENKSQITENYNEKNEKSPIICSNGDVLRIRKKKKILASPR